MTIVFDRLGLPVDVGGDVWSLNEPGTLLRLDWRQLSLPTPVYDAGRAYERSLIATKANGTVKRMFDALRTLSGCEAKVLRDDGTLGPEFQSELMNRGCGRVVLQVLRGFYKWSVESGLAGFSLGVLNALYAARIGPAPFGEEVREGRPDRGPITQAHVDRLARELQGRRGSQLQPDEKAAVVISMVFGPNSGPIALLRVNDHDAAACTLMVPRHKKGLPPRAEFRERRLDEVFVREVLEQAVTFAREVAEASVWPDGSVGLPPGVAVPLLPRRTPLREHAGSGSAMREYALHKSNWGVTRLVCEATKYLCPDLGPVTPRRFRETLATDLLESGCSSAEVADILDHESGTGLVLQVYAAGGPRIVGHLDAALENGPYREMVSDLEEGLALP